MEDSGVAPGEALVVLGHDVREQLPLERQVSHGRQQPAVAELTLSKINYRAGTGLSRSPWAQAENDLAPNRTTT